MKKLITFFIILAIIGAGAIVGAKELMFPISDKDIIEKYAKEFKVEPSLVVSIIDFETEFSPSKYEPGKAVGYMKLTDKTGEALAKELGDTKFDKTTIADKETNIKLGTYYLSKNDDKGLEETVGKWAIRNGLDEDPNFDLEGYAREYYVEKIESREKMYKLLYPSLNK